MAKKKSKKTKTEPAQVKKASVLETAQEENQELKHSDNEEVLCDKCFDEMIEDVHNSVYKTIEALFNKYSEVDVISDVISSVLVTEAATVCSLTGISVGEYLSKVAMSVDQVMEEMANEHVEHSHKEEELPEIAPKPAINKKLVN